MAEEFSERFGITDNAKTSTHGILFTLVPLKLTISLAFLLLFILPYELMQ